MDIWNKNFNFATIINYLILNVNEKDFYSFSITCCNSGHCSSNRRCPNSPYGKGFERRRGINYRLVNPFKNSKYASERYYHSSHNHYIYINADNADCIFLEESPIGFDFGQGLVRYSSSARYYLDAGFELEECIELGLGAEYSDGKLSFGDEAILVSALGYDNGDWYITDAGTEIVLPDGVDLSGVESVIDDNNENAKVELYNLQGIRITNPQEGQFYIKRQGNKVSKLIF